MLVENGDEQGEGEYPFPEGGGRQTVHVFIYGNQENIVMQRLKEAIQSVVSMEQLEEFHTLESLSNGLRRPLLGRVIAVLLAESREDLSGLLSIRVLLQDILVILILPDREKGTISKGHLFRPRYLTYVDGDFEDIAAVLAKMLKLGGGLPG